MGPPQAVGVAPDRLVYDALQLDVRLPVYEFADAEDSILCGSEQRLVCVLAQVDCVPIQFFL